MRLNELVNQYPRQTANQIIKKIEKYDTVSFDIFDTLIKRDVAKPIDVFDYIERKYNQQFNGLIVDFREKRYQAWYTATKKAGRREICLSDIYEQLLEANGGTINKETAHRLMKTELELEEELACPNPVMAEVYQYCVKEKKRIICVSDMYLSREFIEKLLIKNGYSKIDKIYVSSEEKVKKESGELFRVVLETENIEPGALIHIGDSKRSDFLAAHRLGIHTICIAKNDWNTRYWEAGDSLDANSIKAFLSNRLPYIKERRESIGYEVFGPLLYMFVRWLCEQLDQNKTILFFSRDCYVVKQGYDIMTDSESGDYFLASRKSLMKPVFYFNRSVDVVQKMLRSQAPLISLRDILDKFDLEATKYTSMANKHGMTLETILRRDSLSENEHFIALWEEIEQDLEEDSKRNYIGFHTYCSKYIEKDIVQVVDIGWRCTMQYCLQMLLGEKKTIIGLYLGIRDDPFVNKSKCKGFYIDGKKDEHKALVITEISGLLETFFSAPHGSIGGYDYDGTVLFEPYERENDEYSKQLIEKLHNGALHFVRDMMASPLHQLIQIDSDLLFRGLEYMAVNPKEDEIEMFSNIPFNNGAGVEKMAAPKSWSYYTLHPKQCWYDFANSYWKTVFLRKLFKVPIPYDKLLRCIYKAKDRLTK